jgi:hypothetical protein
MEIVGQGIVFSGEKGSDHASCAFAGIAVLPRGRWVCGFRAAPTKKGTAGQRALVAISDDEGSTWPTVCSPFSPPSIEGRPGLFRAAYPTALGGDKVLAALCWVDYSDPALPFFNEETEGLLDTRIFFSLSKDRGDTWSAPRLINTSPFKVPTPLTGPVLILPDAEWALQFELNKPYYDRAPWQHASVFMFSFDRGQSWPHHVVVSHDPNDQICFWDQRPAVLADGSLLDVFWTYDRRAADYLNIHARKSTSGGRGWSELWDTGVPGQPAQPVSLRDGRTVMVYVDRTAEPAIKLRVSSDGGKTWPEETEMILYQPELASQSGEKRSMQDAWSEMERFSLGLPATALLANGDLLVVFYAGPEPDLTDILWLRLKW